MKGKHQCKLAATLQLFVRDARHAICNFVLKSKVQNVARHCTLFIKSKTLYFVLRLLFFIQDFVFFYFKFKTCTLFFSNSKIG